MFCEGTLLTSPVLHGGLDATHNLFVLATGHVGNMETFKEVFEDVFICLNLFICLSILGLMLIWLIVEDLFRFLVQCQLRQIVEKLRVINMALDIISLSNVTLNQY